MSTKKLVLSAVGLGLAGAFGGFIVESFLTGHENRQFKKDRIYDEDERNAKRSNVFSSLNMSRQTGSVLTGAAVGIGLVAAGLSVSSIMTLLKRT
jgi:hypothetical protein